jgi:uncharacterized protein YmfQ (DUF2313 family)
MSEALMKATTLFFSAALVTFGAEPAVLLPLSEPPAQASVAPDGPAHRTVEHDGQTFELVRSTADQAVRTDEYVVAGEKIADWTQLVTVQRLTRAMPARIDAFLAYFRKRVTEDGATFEVLKEAKTAGVFVVRFPKSERNEEQVMICLALAGGDTIPHMDIVQYAIKPTRLPVDVVEMRIRSWKDQFLAQAKGAAEP